METSAAREDAPPWANPNGPPRAGRLRPVPMVKTLILSIVTLGVYFLVRSYKNSGDLHRIPGGNAHWQLLFWLHLIPALGLVFALILYFQNNRQANHIRRSRGLQATYTPFVLACIPGVNAVAPFVWAVHFNEVARRT